MNQDKALRALAKELENMSLSKAAAEVISLLKISSEKKTIWVLVGPPSVGKSTWIKNNFEQPPYVISRDDLVEVIASKLGWTYDDMFTAPPRDYKLGDSDEEWGTVIKSPSWMGWQPLSWDRVLKANDEVQQLMDKQIDGAISADRDIVVDMTNLTPGARAGALKAIKGHEAKWNKVAVEFVFEGAEDTIKEVAKLRAEEAKRQGKSKTIPGEVYDKMFGQYKPVQKGEGFDEVKTVDNRPVLKGLLDKS